MGNNSIKKQITELLNQKAPVKQKVFDKTREVFQQMKKLLEEIEAEYNGVLISDDERIRLQYKDRGEFVAQLKVAGDMLIFNMHSNTFEFDRDHEIWKNEYSKKDVSNTYCGVIYFYNFLYDSFKYKRHEDIGYLVARLFVNKDGYFFVEGKRQRGMGVKSFGKKKLDNESLKKIIEVAVFYSLSFDLLVPPYDDMIMMTLMQVEQEIMNSGIKTGKRLGFQYKSDDVKG
ncbi:MAG: hypothetical protein GXO47_04180 [Chlorobi bacterium]|nr:hypothetical protein [Chlorobiota bacterium]